MMWLAPFWPAYLACRYGKHVPMRISTILFPKLGVLSGSGLHASLVMLVLRLVA